MTHTRVLVAGATGRLGMLVDLLLERGHAVLAITRDPSSPAAARLRAAGAEVIHGDFDDSDSIASAAVAAGVPHLVYSSGDGAAPDSPPPLFRVKHEVEQYIRSMPIAHSATCW